MQGGAAWRELGQPPFDRGVNVFVCVFEIELARVELALDPAQSPLDGGELRSGEQSSRGQPASVRDAPGDVERIELEVDLERRRELLELGQKGPAKSSAPELAYGASLFTSPSKLPSSRACSWPWTRAEVRTPIPQSLMKPAAADWSNTSPFP